MRLINSFTQKMVTFRKRAVSATLAAGLILSTATVLVPQSAAASTSAGPRVSFTFDDGYSSAVTDAAPTLQKYGFTGTDYVITKCVGMTTAPNTCRADQNATYMTWAQVKSLQTTYGWEIGSHTQTHPYLASSDATDGQPNVLTPAQVTAELNGAVTDFAAQGITNVTDFASPYGDWLPPVLANIAKTYASHRGFADSIDQNADGIIDHGNTFPYNDHLLYDLQVQAGVTVAKVKSYIDQTKASNQWLVLTFHNIKPVASTSPDDYEYNTADLDQIAAYVKSLGIPVVNINAGLATGTNMFTNGGFDTALSATAHDPNAWSTSNATAFKRDTANNGSYPSATNSISITGTTSNASLFGPQVAVDSTKKYVIKNFLNVTNMTVAAGHEIAFYMDEYDANGVYLSTKYLKSEVGNAGNATGAWVETLSFEYTPTNANVKKASYQAVVTANSGAKAFLDNVVMFAEDGTIAPPVVVTTPPATLPATTKNGDLNGDGKINIFDLSILTKNWNKSGMTKAQGDLNGDGKVNILDLSILAANWNK